MKRTFFMVGFVLGLVLFVAANIYSYRFVEPPCCDFSAPFGFPLPMGRFGGFTGSTNIFWPGLIANALVSLGAGFVLGWVFTKLLPLLGNLFRQAMARKNTLLIGTQPNKRFERTRHERASL